MAATTITGIINKITQEVLDPLVLLLFTLAIVVFVWGVINYVLGSQGDEKKLEQGRRVMLWGIIGMFVMASAWGIIKLLCDFFGTCQGITFP